MLGLPRSQPLVLEYVPLIATDGMCLQQDVRLLHKYPGSAAMTHFNAFSPCCWSATHNPFRPGVSGCLQAGLTAIELLVVIAIVGVLATVAVPSMLSTSNMIKQRSAYSLVLDDLNRTKAEAIKHNARVLMCARDAAGADCALTGNWQSGWLVCMEDPALANHCLAETSTNPNPLVVRPALDAVLTLVKTSTTATDPVRFSANSAGTLATLTVGGTWTGASNRVVSVAASGGISKQ